MIDSSTAWAILSGSSLAMAAVATVGWRYEAKWKRYWAKEAEEAQEQATKALDQRDTWKRLASDLQERLDTEAAKRSSITSRGNLTKAAKRRAAQDARTAQLNQEIAERMDVTADRIAA